MSSDAGDKDKSCILLFGMNWYIIQGNIMKCAEINKMVDTWFHVSQ